MIKLKENVSHLIVKMKNLIYISVILLLYSCTSNTIFEKPEDLIPKDSMSLLIQEMNIASSSRYIKNKNLEKNINYMTLVYDRFRIDSIRFQTSNLYYMSKVDLYQEILNDAKTSLKEQKEYFDSIKKSKDSIRKGSNSKNNGLLRKINSKNKLELELK